MTLTVSKLAPGDKHVGTFIVVDTINKESFSGVELPPAQIFETMFKQGEVYVTKIGDHIVGFAIVDEKNYEPYIRVIAVKASYRGRGFGGMLLRAIAADAAMNKKHFVELSCKIDNVPAIKLYLDLGYRIRNVARGFYGAEGDGLIMRRDLC